MFLIVMSPDVPLVISVVGPEPEAASARAAQPAGGTSYSMLGDMQVLNASGMRSTHVEKSY